MAKAAITLFLIISLIAIVSAAPPFISSTDTGFLIEPVNVDYIKQEMGRSFYIHVINQSNGFPINSGLTCYMHLYNSTGDHLVILETSTSEDMFDYKFSVDGANFTKGLYSAKFQCNNSARGGPAEISFEANKYGIAPPEGIVLVFFSIGFLLIIASLTSLLLYTLGLFVEKEFTMKHLIYNLSAYMVIFGFYILEQEYFRHELISDILLVFLEVGSITNIIFPFIVFIISVTIWKWQDLEKW